MMTSSSASSTGAAAACLLIDDYTMINKKNSLTEQQKQQQQQPRRRVLNNNTIKQQQQQQQQQAQQHQRPNQQVQQPEPTLLHRALFSLVHILIALVHSLHILALQLVYALMLKYEQVTGGADLRQLFTNTSDLAKNIPPSHVCVVFNEVDDNAVDDYPLFAFIASSLASYGVRTLTFYKFKSIRSDVRQRLLDEFSKKDDNNNETKTATVAPIKLNFFNHSTSSQLLTSVCKKISGSSPHAIKVDQELIELHLTELIELSEPEMVVSVGANDTLTAGFFPWHLRLSEIMKIPSPKLVNKYTIRSVIEKYKHVEKRFGK